MKLALRLVIAAVAGACLAAAFAPLSWSWLIFIGALGLIAACWRAPWWHAGLVGLISGTVFFALLVSWMSIVGVDAWIGVVAYLVFWFVLAAIGTALTSWLPAPAFWITAVWIAEETLRARIPFGGFPWGRFAFGAVGTGAEFAASIGGAALTTGVVMLLASSIVWMIAVPTARTFWIAGSSIVAVVIVCVIGYATTIRDAGTTSRVAVVQGSVPEYGMGAMDTRRVVLNNHLRETIALSQRGMDVDAVIWPENASDLDPLRDANVARDLSTVSGAVNAPILVGAVVVDPMDPRYRLNVGIVWTAQGPGQMYAKTHPVPFGEYIPFRAQLAGYTDRFDRIPSDFAAGERPGNLDLAGVNVGDVICFEIAYDDVVRAVVRGGAQYIAVQTNNATYGDTSQPDQQLAITRLAAIEHGRWVAVAATSGVSGFIDPHGNVVQQLKDNSPGSLVQDVPLVQGLTVADRINPWGEFGITLLAFLGVGLGVSTRVRARRLG